MAVTPQFPGFQAPQINMGQNVVGNKQLLGGQPTLVGPGAQPPAPIQGNKQTLGGAPGTVPTNGPISPYQPTPMNQRPPGNTMFQYQPGQTPQFSTTPQAPVGMGGPQTMPNYQSYMQNALAQRYQEMSGQQGFSPIAEVGPQGTMKPIVTYQQMGGPNGQPSLMDQFQAATNYDTDMQQYLANQQQSQLRGVVDQFTGSFQGAANSIGAMGAQQGQQLRGVGDQERDAFAQEQAAIIGGFKDRSAQQAASYVFGNKANLESQVMAINQDPNMTPAQKMQAQMELQNTNDQATGQALIAAGNNYNEGMASLRTNLLNQQLSAAQSRQAMYQMAASVETAAEAAKQQYLTSGWIQTYNMLQASPPTFISRALGIAQMMQLQGGGGGGGYMGVGEAMSAPEQIPQPQNSTPNTNTNANNSAWSQGVSNTRNELNKSRAERYGRAAKVVDARTKAKSGAK